MIKKQEVVRKIRWNAEDWDKICFQLHKTNPTETHSSTLMGFKEVDIKAAMRKVLPESKHRNNVINMTQTRPILLEGFKRLRKRLNQLEHDRQAHEAQAKADDHDKAKNALTPLAELLAQELMKQLKPMMDDYIRQAIATVIPAEVIVQKAIQSVPDRKVRVGVMGLLPIQQHSVEAEFPHLEFTFVEDTSRADEVRSRMGGMDVVFGLTQKMSHTAEQVLKKMPVWNQYRRVAGKGTSAMKHSIKTWMATSI